MDKTKRPNKQLQYHRARRGWSQARMAEKIGATVKRVSMWECGESVPDRYYQEQLCELFGKNAEELGFLHQDGRNENALPPHEERLPEQHGVSKEPPSTLPIHIVLPQSLVHSSSTIHVIVSTTPLGTNPLVAPSQNEKTSVLIDGNPRPDAYFPQVIPSPPVASLSGEIVDRRAFVQEGLQTGAAILTSPSWLTRELLDRFSRALKKPSTIDERMLTYQELRTAGYWQDRHRATLSSRDLLRYVFQDLEQVVKLLEESVFPSVRARLCSIASGIAQLAGHLLFDLGELASARTYHQLAITAAREGDHLPLEAVAWGRMSFTWTYGGNSQEALRCIQEARRLAPHSVNRTVQSYLAAVEAEIHAVLGNRESTFKALDVAARLDDRQYSQEEMYWLRFDRSRLAGYQGICYRRLYRPDDPQTHSFLDKAREALTEALATLDTARIQRRPALLIDIASTYAQQGDAEGASEHAMQAFTILAQTKSQAVAKRLFWLRQELELWKETQAVQNLDQQIGLLFS